MPFYMFGEMLHLDCIPTEYWVPFICSRFEKYGKKYLRNMLQESVNRKELFFLRAATSLERDGRNRERSKQRNCTKRHQRLAATMSWSFVQQTEGLTTYQLNFLRLLCSGVHSGFTAQAVTETYPLGSKSNIDRIKKALIDKELITLEKDGVFIADCVFELWFKKEIM